MSAKTPFKTYAHADPESLNDLFENADENEKLVLTESVFSMDGDVAPLPELSNICRARRGCLVVDDAHGFGVLGKSGLGAMEKFSLSQNDVPLMVATFGKALGVYGAFIAGNADLIEVLVQRAKPYIYSTSLPVPIVSAVKESLDVMAEEGERREQLSGLVDYFRSSVIGLGLNAPFSNTPIQPIVIGDSKSTMNVCDALEQNGIFVMGIRPPTVPKNTARLRIVLSAVHTFKQIDQLLEGLEFCMRKKLL